MKNLWRIMRNLVHNEEPMAHHEEPVVHHEEPVIHHEQTIVPVTRLSPRHINHVRLKPQFYQSNRVLKLVTFEPWLRVAGLNSCREHMDGVIGVAPSCNTNYCRVKQMKYSHWKIILA